MNQMKFSDLCRIAVCISLMVVTRHGYQGKLVAETRKAPQFIPEAKSMRILSLGFEKVLADIFWLGFMQYVGDDAARVEDHYKMSVDYANLVTELDPNFVGAYYFAAFLIGSELKNPSAAAEIIERGISANPDEWSLPFVAGVNQYLYAHDEPKAAKYYHMAARYPGAPKWLNRQADILGAKIPSVIKEINVWSSVYSGDSNSVVKERARNNLVKLWTQVYNTSPSSGIKNRARSQLLQLGEVVSPSSM